MKKGKALFVTIIITIMLIIIDISLFKLNRNGFIILTSAITVYGYFRAASDFCGWLIQDAEESEQPAKYLPGNTSSSPNGKNIPIATNGGRSRD